MPKGGTSSERKNACGWPSPPRSTRGVRSPKRAPRRVIHRSGGSTTCESADASGSSTRRHFANGNRLSKPDRLHYGLLMDFEIPAEIRAYLAELDAFIEKEIKPLEQADDNVRFFDHRREWARTDFDRGGLPRHEWEALLEEMRRRADRAGHFRFALPKEYGGRDGSNLAMAIIREYL